MAAAMSRSFFIVAVLGALLPALAWCQPPALQAIWGSTGDQPGQFIHPTALALDPSGNLYVADLVNHRIQVLSSSGVFVRQWGSYGDDPWSLSQPTGVATDASGHVFVAEWSITSPSQQTGFQVFTTSGAYLASWRIPGCDTAASCGPFGVAVGPEGYVYVTISGAERVQVFTGAGEPVAQWSVVCRGVAVDAGSNVYVTDTGSGLIRKFSSSGVELASWPAGGIGLAVDGQGYVYVADMNGDRVQVFTDSGVFVTEWGSYGSEPGQFYRPMGIAVGADGRVFVADTYNNRIQVFGPVPTPAQSTSWGRIKALYR